jgi:hypothetical protein
MRREPTGDLPQLHGNPLLEHHERTRGSVSTDERDALIAKYGFAIPTDRALDAVAEWSPGGVVEVGAGCGYWARMLAERGVDVVAYDLAPAPSADNEWFAGTTPWYPVVPGDETVAARHPERTLLLVWPTRGELWPTRALEAFHDAAGRRVAYVGEGPGGRTGDDLFHAVLGDVTTCVACRHGVADRPCICSTTVRWKRCGEIALPHWDGYVDDLHLYERAPTGRSRRWSTRSSRSR